MPSRTASLLAATASVFPSTPRLLLLSMPAASRALRSGGDGARRRHLVLVGGGHAHVQVVKALRRAARPASTRITLVDPCASAAYSGMVPGCVARLYAEEDARIPLGPLATWAGMDFVRRRVVDVDPVRRRLFLDRDDDGDGESAAEGGDVPDCLEYDVVSFDIGSTSRGLRDTPGAAARTIPTRPIAELVRRVEEAEASLEKAMAAGSWTGPARVVVVGGGAAGIELALAIRARWRGLRRERGLDVTLLDRGAELLPDETAPCRAALRRVLSERDVAVKHGATVKAVESDVVLLEGGERLPFTHAIWATGARRHPLADALRDRGVAVSDRGWIRVGPALQSVSHPDIFAAGDCCAIEGLPDDRAGPPKAGVYAVRAGPILVENLTKALAGGPKEDLAHYEPQGDFLKLLMAGDGTALGFRFGLPLRGKWVWELKDHIDRTFVDAFRVPAEPLPEAGAATDDGPDAAQFDAVVDDERRGTRTEPEDAAALLRRTDDAVDFRAAWSVLRAMMRDGEYRAAVLDRAVEARHRGGT